MENKLPTAEEFIKDKLSEIHDENIFEDLLKRMFKVDVTECMEEFAKKYTSKYYKKPTLEEFNDFISDFNIWDNIKVIRFQDVPENNDLVEVNGYYYKKRIQLRVNEPEIITNFALHKNFLC